jgi:dehydrogenase/reductase SDR family protein 1
MNRPKVCIVTGASRGLGRGIALVLAREEGCRVYATARNEDALNELAEEAAEGSKGGKVVPCKLDQSDDGAVHTFVNQINAKESQLDLLVNSAYGGLVAVTPHFGKHFWEKPISVFDASLNIGLRSAFVMSALVAPLMIKNKAGLIVQISSFGGVNYLFDVGYGVGKAGLDRLTTDMAVELKPYDVHAVTLYPGGAVTEIAAFPGGETPVFTGRAVAALINTATKEELAQMNGKVVQTVELAVDYGFTDVDGQLPSGPFSNRDAAKQCRETMSKPLIQYDTMAELPDSSITNNPDMASMFPGT